MSEGSRKVDVLGAPIDYGTSQRGVAMGPVALRLAGLFEKLEAEGIEARDLGDLMPPMSRVTGCARGTVEEIRDACSGLADRVETSLRSGRTPVVLGGDHSIAIGTVAGASRHCRSREWRLGLLWIDAHGDMNTEETSPSGNIHGMPLAIALGEGIPELVDLGGFSPKAQAERTALVGIRNVDDRERDIMAHFGLTVFTMKDIDRRGMANVMEQALAVVSRETEFVHVSFDMDAVEPTIAPGVGTPVAGGISYREAHLAMEMIHDADVMRSLDVVETNPFLDVRNGTARLGVELVLSALGKSIY